MDIKSLMLNFERPMIDKLSKVCMIAKQNNSVDLQMIFLIKEQVFKCTLYKKAVQYVIFQFSLTKQKVPNSIRIDNQINEDCESFFSKNMFVVNADTLRQVLAMLVSCDSMLMRVQLVNDEVPQVLIARSPESFLRNNFIEITTSLTTLPDSEYAFTLSIEEKPVITFKRDFFVFFNKLVNHHEIIFYMSDSVKCINFRAGISYLKKAEDFIKVDMNAINKSEIEDAIEISVKPGLFLSILCKLDTEELVRISDNTDEDRNDLSSYITVYLHNAMPKSRSVEVYYFYDKNKFITNPECKGESLILPEMIIKEVCEADFIRNDELYLKSLEEIKIRNFPRVAQKNIQPPQLQIPQYKGFTFHKPEINKGILESKFKPSMDNTKKCIRVNEFQMQEDDHTEVQKVNFKEEEYLSALFSSNKKKRDIENPDKSQKMKRLPCAFGFD